MAATARTAQMATMAPIPKPPPTATALQLPNRPRPEPMDRMNLTLDIRANAIGPKRVNLRSSLLVDNLIATIKDKFNLDGEFELRADNGRQPLPPELELDR